MHKLCERGKEVQQFAGCDQTVTGSLGQIKAISFDGDMTLWDFEKVMRHSLGYALEELRKCLPGEASANLTIDQMIEIRNEVAAQLKGKSTNLEEIRLSAPLLLRPQDQEKD
jgi:hypothetical protein